MEEIYLKLINIELVNITKPRYNKLISYGKFFDIKLIYSLAWIYQFYFEQPVQLFLPKCINITETLSLFNESVGEFQLTNVSYCSLEAIENVNLKIGAVLIYGYADIIFHELGLFKKRINTQLKKIKGKIHMLSYLKLNYDFELNEIKTNMFSFNLIDVIDDEDEIYESNLESLTEFIKKEKDKKIYISMDNISKLKQLEQLILKENIAVSRKECEGIVINSSKTITTSFLKNRYDIYIFICKFENRFDALYYLKELGKEIYFDSTSGIEEIYNDISQFIVKNIPQFIIKDSRDFDNYNDLVKEIGTNFIMASESYYRFNAPDTIKTLNLSNLTKKEYDIIRNFVKLKLNAKLDLDVKTCQLAAPCSPKDRSRKINSFSCKISSTDYRCDVNCEIFKDYTIGIVLWGELMSKTEHNFKGNYVYQTTLGKWKYTSVNQR